MAISFDFSQKIELRYLSALVRAVHAAAGRMPYVLAGATARDILLHHAWGIDTGRQTQDVDFAFFIDSWEHYLSLRRRLLESGQFTPVPPTLHKLKFAENIEVDFVAFGKVERPDRTIAWPPDGAFEMSTFGFREVMHANIDVLLPDGQKVQVISLHALALLKFEAWRERRVREPLKDAHDLRIILWNYIAAGNTERFYQEGSDLLNDPGFDYEAAGAWLLGKDMASLLDGVGRIRVRELLAQEADENGAMQLIGDMRVETGKGLKILSALKEGFNRDRE